MRITETPLEGCLVITPTIFKDERGSFLEAFNERDFRSATGRSVHFVQDNRSESSKGVLRGLHFQTGDSAQSKLVSVVKGRALDVGVDIRPSSPTFGQHFTIVLDAKSHQQLFIPKGFAHGFLALEDPTILSYKCDQFYNQASEAGILFNDPDLNIDWRISESAVLLSEKDRNLPLLRALSITPC